MAQLMSGTCLCGGVTVSLPRPMRDAGVCHCRTCRQWGGGPWMSFQAPGSVIAGETLAIHRSSAFAERGFCRVCGAHIFHRPQDGPELAVSIGLFDTDDIVIAREIFFDRKPPFYRFVADSEKRSTASLTREWLPRLLLRRIGRWLKGGVRPSP